MSDTTRRRFLAAAGVGAAGVAVATVAGATGATALGASHSPSVSEDNDNSLPAGASGGLVAYVDDVRDGRVSVLVGEQQVVIRDRALVARLAKAAATASKSAGA
jgi:hypothetical protein